MVNSPLNSAPANSAPRTPNPQPKPNLSASQPLPTSKPATRPSDKLDDPSLPSGLTQINLRESAVDELSLMIDMLEGKKKSSSYNSNVKH